MKLLIFCSILMVSINSFAQEKTPCGLEGSISERIQDCAPQSHDTDGFALVTRTKASKEVHKDLKTGCKGGISEVGYITEVEWRLPSRAQYEGAHENGIVAALPNMNDFFWSTKVGLGGLHGWLYYAKQSEYYNFVGYWNFHSNKHNARCVAKMK